MAGSTYRGGSTIGLPDGSGVDQVGTTMSKWTDGFAGAAYGAGAASKAALAANGWSLARDTGGITVTLNNGSLVLGMGTTNGAELLMLGGPLSTIPQNLIATAIISQRIAGNEIRIGYAEVDANGALVPNPNLTNFPNNMAGLLASSTVTTTFVLETLEDGIAALKTASATMTAATTAQDFSLELRPEDVTFSQQAADSAVLRASTAPRLSSVVPNPSKLYRAFIWVRNISAPATNTNVTLNRIISMDIQELQAEVGGGRGNLAPSQAVPVVQVAVGTTQPVSLTGAVMGAVTNSNLTHKAESAASGNATSVKATAARLHGGIITNISASTRFFKFFNKASAPTLGTDVPILTIPILAGQSIMLASAVPSVYGLYFATGLAYAITAAAADLDTAVIGAAEVYVDLIYV